MRTSIVLALVSIHLNAQSYRQMVDSAFTLAGKKNYANAITAMAKACEINPGEISSCNYNIACFASLGGNAGLAFEKIFEVLATEDWSKFRFEEDNDFDNIRSNPKWQLAISKIDSLNVIRREIALKQRVLQKEMNGYVDRLLSKSLNELPPEMRYKRLRAFRNDFNFNNNETELTFYIKIEDKEIPFFIQLPKPFSLKNTYPLHITLHGGVRTTSIPEIADKNVAYNYIGDLFFSEAMKKDMITVVPFADKDYNWWNTDAGFSIVPEVVRQMKKLFNIDDNKVYITGHSNGASGATAYLLKEPSMFAAFGGFNNNPRIMTGGTFFMNAINRFFYNVSTDADYYFPYEGHEKLAAIAAENKIYWVNAKYRGPHWFPFMDEAKSAYPKLFNTIDSVQRNPFPDSIYWECDDIRYGKCDWLKIEKLDTLGKRARWHKTINFEVTKWRDINNPQITIDSTTRAFEFPRKSGAIKAVFNNNVFRIEASCVSEISLFISPEMVNIEVPVKIYSNGKLLFDKLVQYDPEFMSYTFEKDFDRKQIWVSAVRLHL